MSNHSFNKIKSFIIFLHFSSKKQSNRVITTHISSLDGFFFDCDSRRSNSLHQIIFRDVIFNLVNLNNTKLLLMTHAFLISLSSLFFENDYFFGECHFLNSCINPSLGQIWTAHNSKVRSCKHENVFKYKLLTWLQSDPTVPTL